MLAFDLMTAYGGKLLALQMKAPQRELSARVDNAGIHHRRFRVELDHHQLMQFRLNFGHLPQTAYYAFPAALVVADYLAAGFDLLQKTFRFDVSLIPAALPAPTAHGKPTPRVSGKHLGDFDPDAASLTLHSDPFDISLDAMANGAPIGSVRDSGATVDLLGSRNEFVDRVLSVPGLLLAIVRPSADQ